MNKKILLLWMAATHMSFAGELIREEYDPKPMIEGNRRVDELIQWNKDHPGEMPPLTEQEKYEFFIKQGVPLPGSGAVVDSNHSVKMTDFQRATVNKFNTDQRIKGFSEQENKRARFLLNLPETAEKEYNARKSIAFDPQDTHLYEVKNNLAMNYDYKGVPESLTSKVIGYAPESTFMNRGWSGAVEFFIPEFGGVCAFREVNIGMTKSSAYIPKEVATWRVNHKITTINAMGNNDSGFIYEVQWWDKQFKRTLECASKDYSDVIRSATLELAIKIDSEMATVFSSI